MNALTGLADLEGRRVGVLGLARSGLAAVRALTAVGAVPILFDDQPDAVRRAQALGGTAGQLDRVEELTMLVASPGVPLHHPVPHPVIAAARAAGVEVTGDVDLFARAYPALPVVGVTGTNGKSTTTALIHHLLVTAGRPALLGGNIGKPVFELGPVPPNDARPPVAVLELSSYQLDLCTRLRCRVAVWLNLSPDHLDRHHDLDGYMAAKRRIFANQQQGDSAVVGVDDERSAALADELEGSGRRVVRVALARTVPDGVGVVDGAIVDALDGRPQATAELRSARGLKGLHNHQNAAAAYAAVRCLGLSATQAAMGLANFAGLPHRMEEVGRIGKVLFVNDSKATNPESATKSLTAFDEVFWIAGGLAKPGGFAGVLPFLGHVERAFLIGSAADELARALEGRLSAERCETLDRAVARAHEAAARSCSKAPVVLLAPACASFDQFQSFEQRGERFRELVGELEGTPLLFTASAAEPHP